MAEINNLEDIKSNFERITNLINSMRAQGVLNFSGIDKVLNAINTRLNELDVTENTDLIKLLISELKGNLEERHSFVATKFSEMEDSINTLIRNNQSQIKSEEIKTLFDVIATNLSVFSKEVVSQKDALTEITLRLEALRVDETNKNDIIQSISVIKFDIAKLNNGFESIILNINNNFNELSQSFERLIQSNEENSLAPAIQDIHATSNSILSAIEILDRKNAEFNSQLERFVTVGDFNEAKDILNSIASKSDNIASVVANTADRESVNNLNSNVAASINAINELRGFVENNSVESHDDIISKLDTLEDSLRSSIDNIDLNQIKSEIFEIVNKIGSETNLMCNDLLETNHDLKKMLSEVNFVDLNGSLNSLYESFAKISTDTHESLEQIEKTIEDRGNVQTNILREQIHSGLENIEMGLSTLKNDVQTSSIENKSEILMSIESLANKLQEIQVNTQPNENVVTLDAFNSSLEDLKSVMTNNSTILDSTLSHTSEQFIINLENLRNATNGIKNDILISAQGNVETLTTQISGVVNSFEALKSALENSNVEISLSGVNEKLSGLEGLIHNLSNDFTQKVESLNDTEKLQTLQNYYQNLSALTEDFKNIYLSNNEEVRERISGIYDSIIAINRQIPEIIQNSRVNIKENISSLELKLDIANQGLSDLVTKFDSNELQNVTVDRIDAVNSDIKFAIAALSGSLDEYNNYLNQKLTEIDSDIKTISGTMIENIGSNHAELNNRLNSIIESIQDIKQVDNRIDDTQIREITDRIANVSDDIKDLIRNSASSNNESPLSIEKLDRIASDLFELKNVITSNISSSNLDISDKISIAKDEINANIRNINENVVNSNSALGVQLQEMSGDVKNVTDKLANYFINNDTDMVERVNNIAYTVSSGNQQTHTIMQGIDDKLHSVKDNLETKSNSILDSLDRFNNEVVENRSLVTEKLAGLDSEIKSAAENILNHINTENMSIAGGISLFSDGIQSRINDTALEIVEKVTQSIEDKSAQAEVLRNVLEGLKTEVLEQLSLTENRSKEIQEQVISKISDIESRVLEIISNNSNVINNLSNDINSVKSEFLDSVNVNGFNLKETINTNAVDLKSEIENRFNQITDSIVYSTSQNTSAISTIAEKIEQRNQDLHTNIDESRKLLISELSAKIETNIVQISEELSNKNSYANDLLIDSLKNNAVELLESMSTLRTLVAETKTGMSSQTNEMVQRLNDSLVVIQNTLVENSRSNLEEIKQEFPRVVENVNSILNEFRVISENINELKESQDLTISTKCGIIVDLLNNIDSKSQERFSNVHGNIDSKFNDLRELITEINNTNRESSSSNLGNLFVSVQHLNEKLENYVPSEGIDTRYLDSIKESMNQNKADIQSYLDTVIGLLNKLSDSSSESTDLDEVMVQLNFVKDSIAHLLSSELESNKSQILNSITTLNGKLDDFKNDINNRLADNGLYEKINRVDESINGIFADIQASSQARLDDIKQYLSSVDNSLEISTRIEGLESGLNEKIAEVQRNTLSNLDEIKSLLNVPDNNEEVLERISGLYSSINNAIDSIQNSTQEKIDSIREYILSLDNQEAINDRINSLEYATKESFEELKRYLITIDNSDVREKLDNLEHLVSGLYQQDDNKNLEQLEDLKSLVETLNSDIKSLIYSNSEHLNQEIKSNIESKIDDSIEVITNKIQENNLTDRFDELKGSFSTLEDLINNSKSELLGNTFDKFNSTNFEIERLQQRLDEIKSQLEIVENKEVNLDDVKDEISSFNDILSSQAVDIANVIDDRTAGITHIFDNISKKIEDLQSELSATTELKMENILGSISSIENMIKTLDENIDEDTTRQLAIIKEELSGVLNTLFASNDKLSSSIDKHFISFTEKINSATDTLSELLSTVDDRVKDSILAELGSMREDCRNLNTIFEQNKSILDVFEGIKADFGTKYSNILQHIEDNSSKDLVDISIAKIDNLEKTMLKSDDVAGLLEEKLDNVSFRAEQEEIISSISNTSEELNTLVDNSRSEILSELDNVHRKLDDIADDYALEKELEDIKNRLSDSSDTIIGHFDEFDKLRVELEKFATEDSLNEGLAKVRSQLENVANSYDLKDRFNRVQDQLDTFANADELQKEFDEVKKHLLTIQSGETQASYVYSLQDVESDIAKLRIAMKELQEVTPDKEIYEINNQVTDISESLNNIKTQLTEAELYELSGLINKMTDDVISISTRTNKLILTSENSANMLKDNIADFRLVIDDIDERTRELAQQTDMSSIHQNLDELHQFVYNMQRAVDSNTEYNSVVNQSLLAIAEWVDNAGETLSSLESKIEKLDDIDEVKALVKSMDKPAEFDYSVIKSLDNKLNQQQERIDSLESKLDKILELVEANDSSATTKKLGSVDRQIAKLNKSVEKLTAYVNEG